MEVESIIGGKLIHRPADDADDEDRTAEGVAQTSCMVKYGRCSHIYENPVQHYRPQLPHFRPQAVKTSALMKVVFKHQQKLKFLTSFATTVPP